MGQVLNLYTPNPLFFLSSFIVGEGGGEGKVTTASSHQECMSSRHSCHRAGIFVRGGLFLQDS